MEVVQKLCIRFLALTWALSGRFRSDKAVAQQILRTCRLQMLCRIWLQQAEQKYIAGLNT